MEKQNVEVIKMYDNSEECFDCQLYEKYPCCAACEVKAVDDILETLEIVFDKWHGVFKREWV
jgi:hypothetical protein